MKFNRGRRFFGQHTLNLNAEYPDYSRIRIHIAHTLFRKCGVLGSETSFLRLYLNRRYQGVYLSIQDPEEPYLEGQGRTERGNLCKSYSTDTSLPAPSEYYTKYRKQTNQEEDWATRITIFTMIETH